MSQYVVVKESGDHRNTFGGIGRPDPRVCGPFGSEQETEDYLRSLGYRDSGSRSGMNENIIVWRKLNDDDDEVLAVIEPLIPVKT